MNISDGSPLVCLFDATEKRGRRETTDILRRNSSSGFLYRSTSASSCAFEMLLQISDTAAADHASMAHALRQYQIHARESVAHYNAFIC